MKKSKLRDEILGSAINYLSKCEKQAQANESERIKVTSLEVLYRMVDGKPYFEIKYKKTGEDFYHVGYSSFILENVLRWKEEYFEVVD